jgi:thymidylate synthase
VISERLVFNRLGTYYPQLLRHVRNRGIETPSRIGNTREILNLQLVLTEPSFCIVGRDNFSEAFMREEIVQLLAGQYDGERLGKIIPRAAELITPATAYGPRVTDQLVFVETELKNSPSSRRAVVYVGRQDDGAATYSKKAAEARAGEMPCTMTWQFHIRDEQLHMSVSMRSWDLVWGLSYDEPAFVAVQMTLARALKVGLGHYVHTAGSAHIYERHYTLPVWSRYEQLDISDLLANTFKQTRTKARKVMAQND